MILKFFLALKPGNRKNIRNWMNQESLKGSCGKMNLDILLAFIPVIGILLVNNTAIRALHDKIDELQKRLNIKD